MKIDIDKLTKEMFKRMKFRFDGEWWNNPVWENHCIHETVAQQIALDEEIRVNEKQVEVLKSVLETISQHGDYPTLISIMKREFPEIIKANKKQLAELNKMKEEL